MICFGDVYRGRRVLLTGHTGFKGSWLATWLKSLGAEVAGFSLDAVESPSHFELLGLERWVHHYVGDVRDGQGLARVIDEFRPDMVFHLAAQALVRRAHTDPVNTFGTNVMGMVNLLDCVRTRPWIEVAVLVTSDKAYRNEEWCWGYRETDALGGHDPYSSSKGCAELVAHSFYQSFLRDTPTRTATTRAGNVIGGGDWAADRIVPDCIRAWTRGESVAVRSPRSTRPWQHVLEPLSGYLLLGAKLWERAEGLNGEAFNLGPKSEADHSVADLLVAMAGRWPGARWHVPEGFERGGHEDMLLKLCCDKAHFHLGWRAILEFAETVDMTLDWYRTWHEGQRDFRSYSTGQIDEYVRLAGERGAVWAQA